MLKTIKTLLFFDFKENLPHKKIKVSVKKI